MQTETAQARTLTIEEYHQLSRESVSHSELEVLRKDPALYHGIYFTGTIPRMKTDAMELGSILHQMVESPDSVEVLQIPNSVLSSNGQRRGKAWTEYKEENAGKSLLTAKDFAALYGMHTALLEHPKAAALLFDRPGVSEQSIEWTDEQTGMHCRCRPDRVCAGMALVDLKTAACANGKEFAAQAYRLGYHRQAAWYQDGWKALTGEELPFVFVVVEKSAPYRCETYELADDFIEQGRTQNEIDLQRLAYCRANDNWHTHTWGNVVKLAMPRWVKFENEWEAE